MFVGLKLKFGGKFFEGGRFDLWWCSYYFWVGKLLENGFVGVYEGWEMVVVVWEF